MNLSIRQVDDLLRQDAKNLTPDAGTEVSRHRANLEGCMRSAKRLLSTASSVVGALTETSSAIIQGSYAGSENGLLFTDQQRLVVENWLFEPTIYETGNEDDAEPRNPSVTSASQTEPTINTFIF